MQVKCYNIEWETDGQDVELPEEVVVDIDHRFGIIEQCEEELSERFGFLVKYFEETLNI